MRKTKNLKGILPRTIGAKFFLFGLSLAIFSSCDKASIIGLDVQPESDLLNVNYSDTTTLQTFTLEEDSLRTDQALITTNVGLLGKYNDPVFGETNASIFTQLRLPSSITSNSFGTNPVCDSVILSLLYSNTFYGKLERKTQKVNLYELSTALLQSTSYYSNNSSIAYGTDDLTKFGNGFSFVPRPNTSDSVVVGLNNSGNPIKERAQLRIPMKTSFGQNLLDQQGTSNLTSNDNFQSFFKGLYISTENTTGLNSGEGNILNFKMADSKLTIFYHYLGQTITFPQVDSVWNTKYDIALNSVARFNKFAHNRSTAANDLQNQLNNNTLQNQTVYVQSLAGVKTKLLFPYLLEQKYKGPIGINKAELVMKIDTSANYQLDTFAAPAKIILFAIAEDGSNVLIPDLNEGDNYFGGAYNATTKEYRFNIARYIQQVLTGKRANTGLYIIASNGAVNANRVVLGGGAPAGNYQMKLNITSTKLY
jgi:hypothetical protein